MPLSPGKSKAAFAANVKAELGAGKPQKQAVAIAYSEQGEHKAEGGEAEAPDHDRESVLDHCASEMMKAFETKDKAAMRESLHVLLADCLERMGR